MRKINRDKPKFQKCLCKKINDFQAFRDYPKQEPSNETFNMESDEDNGIKLVDVELK